MTAQVVRDARQQARRVCAGQYPADRCDDVVLVVSELVGNACRHGQPPVACTVTCDDGEVVVSVQDADPRPPTGPAGDLPAVGVGGESGRGMSIVAALSRVWGWHRTPGGKRVWARM